MKRSILIAILVGVVIVAAGWWYHRHRLLTGRRLEAAQAAAVESALHERIDTADFAGDDLPWGKVLDKLKSCCTVPLLVSEAQADAMGVDRQTWVNVPAGEFPLGELLDQITSGMDLSWRRADGRIEITSYSVAETARNQLFTRVYPLPAASAAGEKLTDDAGEMCELITTVVDPESWDEVGGTGVLETAGGTLVVRQTAAIHRQVKTFLAQMEKCREGQPRQFPLDGAAGDSESKVAQALAEIDSVDFHDVPLEEALMPLAARHGMALRFAKDKLAEAGVTHYVPVSKTLANVSVRTILRETLEQLGLAYAIRDGAVIVTLQEDAEATLRRWCYDVHDLVAVPAGSDFDTLIDLITTTVEPDSWDQVGGAGTISQMGDGWLVISQTPESHNHVQRLLARMRAILAPGVDPAADALLNPVDDVSHAVEAALDRTVTLKFADKPLDVLCAELSQHWQVPIVLKNVALADVRIFPEQPLTADLPPLALRDALAILLEEHKMTFDPRGEALYFTTPEEAESELVTQIIDVRHLLDAASGGFDEDTLLEMMTTCVAPDMWDEVGGPGTQEIFQGLLVFRQTYDVSRQVQQLIDAISEHCLPQSLWGGREAAVAAVDSIWVGLTEREQEIIAKLDQRDTLHVKDPRVEKTIRTICQRHGIPVIFDREFSESSEDVPWLGTSLALDDSPLHGILAKLASVRAGDIVVGHGVMIVIDEEWTEHHLLRRLYRPGKPVIDGQPLNRTQIEQWLMERVDPDTWDDQGGPGLAYPINDEWLLVVQTLPMHRKVEEALAKLSRGEVLPLPQSDSIMLRSHQWFLDGIRAVEESWGHVNFPENVFIGYPLSWRREVKSEEGGRPDD